MTGTAAETSERIVAAATAEFAGYGISGARVERIAKAARTSKERVYAYFSSKEALYRHVVARELEAMAAALRLDPADLPGYAGRLHDHVVDHPERHRLVLWGRLELPPGQPSPSDPLQESLRGKVEQLRRAQEAGLLDAAWSPEDVLEFVTQLATSVAGRMDLPLGEREQEAFLRDRRAAVVAAVARLFPPAAPELARGS